MFRTTGIAALTAAALAAPGAAGAQESGESVVAALAAVEDLGTTAHTVRQAGLADALEGEGPFTVFAPSNDAWTEVSEDRLDTLLKDEEALAAVLQDHVVAGRVAASDLEDGMTVETLSGETLEVALEDGSASVGGATVERAGIEASNGLIHQIDAVIIEDGGA